MERSSYSEAYCSSADDRSSSLPRTSALEDTPWNGDDSFYRALLRHHQKMIHGNNGESFEWETNISCPKIPHCRSRGSRNSMLGISTSSGSYEDTSPPSLYSIITGETGEKTNLGLTRSQQDDQQCDRLQPSPSNNLFDTSMNNHRLEQAAAVLSSSSLPCDFNDMSAGSTDCTDTATILPRMSSFYRDALTEAALIEEDFELPLQKEEQDISLEEERHFSGALDDNDAANIRTPARTLDRCNASESNGTLISASTPISPFYRAALEDAAPAEEEELLLLQQHRHQHHHKHQHEHKRNQQDQDATTIIATSTTGTSANTNIYTPSSFYRSALKEAMVAEQELGAQGETGEDEEDADFSAAVNDTASLMDLEPDLRSDFAIEPAANIYGRDRDNDGTRQSTMCSFSSSPNSSDSNAPSTSGLALPPVLTRAITNDFNPIQLQRLLSDASSTASMVLPIERGAITPDRRSESFVDDSCAFSVTRSAVMPHVTNSVLPNTREEAEKHATRSNTCLFVGKATFHDSRDLECSESVLKDRVDDEIEDLQLAMYLSRFESSGASSLNSVGTLSDSLSTGGSCCVSEDESKNNHFSDQILASFSPTKNNSEFLISQFKAIEEYQRNNHKSCSPSNRLSESLSTGGSRCVSGDESKTYSGGKIPASCNPTGNNGEFLTSQFKAMEECQRNNHKSSSPSNQTHGVSYRSSAPPTSGENHFPSLRAAAISSPSYSEERRQRRRRSLLETRGVTETRQAISNGNSRIVKCKGCRGRLQAPVYYSLVFCPKCQTVSPA